MIPQIVYVLVANERNLYLEEMWVSIWSLRQYHPDANVRVLVDGDTYKYLKSFPKLMEMISEVVVVPTPQNYNAKQRSRQIKTTVRNCIEGDFLFIDTDTVICHSLCGIECAIQNIKNFNGIAAVPDGHLTLKDCLFAPNNKVKEIFGVDCSDAEYWFNSGVMYVTDTPLVHDFYLKWNENWTFSCFSKGNSQDQPSLLKTDRDFGYMIRELPGIYNAQVAMSLKYFANASILHWWHMDFIEDQSYSPYFSLAIYQEVKENRSLTEHVKELVTNAKQSFVSPTMPVGKDQILFLFSPVGKIYNRIYKEGGAASWLMLKIAVCLDWFHKCTKKR